MICCMYVKYYYHENVFHYVLVKMTLLLSVVSYVHGLLIRNYERDGLAQSYHTRVLLQSKMTCG